MNLFSVVCKSESLAKLRLTPITFEWFQLLMDCLLVLNEATLPFEVFFHKFDTLSFPWPFLGGLFRSMKPPSSMKGPKIRPKASSSLIEAVLITLFTV